MMTNEKMNVVLSSVLLFFICFSSLISNIDGIVQSDISIKYPYAIYDGIEHSNPIEWYIKELSIVLMPVFLFIIWVFIKPDFPKWINVMWFYFFVLIVIDHTLFYQRMPWRYVSDAFVCIVQVVWSGYYLIKND
jgi:hypothetical protein